MRSLSIAAILILVSGSLYADPLQDEIAQWKKFVATYNSTDENWTALKPNALSIITRAESNLQDGRRYYAFYLLAAIRPFLAAQKYLSLQPPDTLEQLPALESEWKKIGVAYQDLLSHKEKPDFEGVPAAYRASGEAAFSEIRPYYEPSLEYAQATMASAGFYYLGSAQAQREFVQFCERFRGQPAPEPLSAPGLKNELDSLEDLILENYKPPASMDQHPVFIRVSAMLKQARELYDSGFYDGALAKMLDARVRLGKMLHPGNSITPQRARERAADFISRLHDDERDESIARLFIEMALGESQNQDPEAKGGETARAVLEDALPHYSSALQKPKALPPKTAPVVTVTLVRWPYT